MVDIGDSYIYHPLPAAIIKTPCHPLPLHPLTSPPVKPHNYVIPPRRPSRSRHPPTELHQPSEIQRECFCGRITIGLDDQSSTAQEPGIEVDLEEEVSCEVCMREVYLDCEYEEALVIGCQVDLGLMSPNKKPRNP